MWLIPLSTLPSNRCKLPFLVPRRFVEILGGLRGPSDPFIDEWPVPVATEEFEHHAFFHIDPFEPLFHSSMTICLDFVQLCRPPYGCCFAAQCPATFSWKGRLHPEHMRRNAR